MNRARAVRLIAVLAVLASACTGSQTAQPKRSPVPHGGTLRVGLLRWNGDFPYDPATLSEPTILSSYPCCLNRTLYYYNGRPADEGGGVVRPDLATGLPEVSADGLTWTVRIRQGLHYAPPLQQIEITAPDVIRAIHRLLSPPVRGYGTDYFLVIEGAQEYVDGKSETISGLEAPDPHTLRLHLTEQNGDIPYRLGIMGTGPIPPNPFRPGARFGVADGHSRDGYGRFLVSTGPYMIQGSEKVDFSKPPKQQRPASGLDPLVLVRNPSWKRSADPLRPAYPDRIEFHAHDRTLHDPLDFPTPDEGEKYQLTFAKKVDRGEIDVLGDWPSPKEQVRRYESNPSLKGRLDRYEFHDVRFIAFNLAIPPFDDVHVRRAANFVVNRTRINEIWEQGLGATAHVYHHLAPNTTQNNLLADYQPYRSDGHTGNLVAARREMRLSAYDSNHDGMCDRSCDLGRVLWRNDLAYPKIAKALRDDLSKIGITFDHKLVGAGSVFLACENPEAHPNLCPLGWLADYPSAGTFFLPLYSSKQLGTCCNLSLTGATKGQLRKWGYKVKSVPNVDARIKACEQSVGVAQVQCWVAFDVYLMEDVVPAIPMLIDVVPWTFSERVARFSWDQVAAAPALDKIALKLGTDQAGG